jgi:hypothetical protein
MRPSGSKMGSRKGCSGNRVTSTVIMAITPLAKIAAARTEAIHVADHRGEWRGTTASTIDRTRSRQRCGGPTARGRSAGAPRSGPAGSSARVIQVLDDLIRPDATSTCDIR